MDLVEVHSIFRYVVPADEHQLVSNEEKNTNLVHTLTIESGSVPDVTYRAWVHCIGFSSVPRVVVINEITCWLFKGE